ncbi:Lrp/AsnC family transcriptional regulator [Bradyrhizobium sp. NP1]|uniref:Lrp/AsnC family transcriptional regulator n=1 Tax=Bradyrhizobium sp. NP1 TaxID=3049772 RepID=UPI0025A61A53|nr:Lrp/AsnC family transcriptional regulator [Bradyrhizobium sp. NP1]WJR75713.1 Lrp/AsnC family transcriptional regulator [Bradyrhizobium sp. NP1]
MIEYTMKIDKIDLAILSRLQKNSTLSQRDLAEQVGLSQNACWRRLQRLNASGLLKGTTTDIDLAALGLDLTVFVMVRTRHHSKEWADRFRRHVERLPEVIDFHRIGGDWDYMIKVVAKGMHGYDVFYQRLITSFDLDRVTGLFSMEGIVRNRPVDLTRLVTIASDA